MRRLALLLLTATACTSSPAAASKAGAASSDTASLPPDTASLPGDTSATGALADVTTASAEYIATEADFGCIKNGTLVGHFYVENRLGQTDLAVAMAKKGAPGGAYPVGTIIRLFPLEAMVKRGGAAFASTGGWEMFKLENDGKAIHIAQRGGLEVKNAAGSCAGCHGAAKDFDFVCAQDHGCVPLAVTPELVQALQDTDPTCP